MIAESISSCLGKQYQQIDEERKKPTKNRRWNIAYETITTTTK